MRAPRTGPGPGLAPGPADTPGPRAKALAAVSKGKRRELPIKEGIENTLFLTGGIHNTNELIFFFLFFSFFLVFGYVQLFKNFFSFFFFVIFFFLLLRICEEKVS